MSKKRGSGGPGRRTSGTRHYPRTARLKELFREILAEELDRIDDPRLELVTVIEVDVDADLHAATLYFAAPHDPADPDADALDAEVLAALADNRIRLQGAIGRQARVKRVPELGFKVDTVTGGAARIEEILRDLPELQGGGADDETAIDDPVVDDPAVDDDTDGATTG
ncbi:MAG: ribosome-binding factor A [Acidimicrobiia bacterium]|nr:ribosome-binding factor A [Acidimicrobiia bacterium]